MLNEIGSNFWINPNEKCQNKELGSPQQFGCLGSDYVWMSTGRSAIKYVIKTIEERNPLCLKKVILPPFTCHTVIEPFIDAKYEIEYFDVDENLNFNIEDICNKVDELHVGILLYHRYYGFDTMIGDVGVIRKMRDKGIVVIEDCTQCLYSSFNKSVADYTVGSIRKWLGTPDGGFAVCRVGKFLDKPNRYDVYLEKAKVLASIHKYNYLFENIGNKETFLQEYRTAEDILSNQNCFYSICDKSVQLQSNLDVNELIKARVNNYKVLCDNIVYSNEIFPLFNDLSDNVVPLYFPIIVRERNILQTYLVKNSIFAPVVWPKPNDQTIVINEAEYLYEHLLCIPIDQRYGIDDMLRVVEIINAYIKSKKI